MCKEVITQIVLDIPTSVEDQEAGKCTDQSLSYRSNNYHHGIKDDILYRTTLLNGANRRTDPPWDDHD